MPLIYKLNKMALSLCITQRFAITQTHSRPNPASFWRGSADSRYTRVSSNVEISTSFYNITRFWIWRNSGLLFGKQKFLILSSQVWSRGQWDRSILRAQAWARRLWWKTNQTSKIWFYDRCWNRKYCIYTSLVKVCCHSSLTKSFARTFALVYFIGLS